MKLTLIALPVLAALDFLWFAILMSRFYRSELGSLARRSGESLSLNWPAAILVYVLLAIGLSFFAIPKAGGRVSEAMMWGALFGFVVYGVYDLTNLSVIAGWSLKMTIVDILWGTISGCLTAGSTVVIASHWSLR